MRGDVVHLAKALINEDTTAPPGNEKKCARVLRDYFQDLHLDDCTVETDEFASGRANLLVKVGPDRPGLVLSGHIDVVPAGDLTKWTTGPFDAHVRGGKLYGRGAVDMKGAVAAMACAVRSARGSKLKRRLVFAATAGEEVDTVGLESLLNKKKLTKEDAMYCVIGEPSELKPVRGHRGGPSLLVKFAGRSAHASKPELGANAVEMCARFMMEVESWEKKLGRQRDKDLGVTILSNTVVRGGTKSNVIPDSCELEIDCRTIMRHDRAYILDGLQKIAERVTDHQKEIKVSIESYVDCPPFLTRRGHPLVRLCEEVSGNESTIAGYGTEAPWYVAAGIPTMVLGPGSVFMAHKPDEYIEVREADRASSVYSELIRRVCS